MKRADLHIHSKFSDSTLSAEEIFQRASEQDIGCISIADHDTLDLYFSTDVGSLSEKYSVEVIKGIEFSSEHKGWEVHLLGYFSLGLTIPDFLREELIKIKDLRYRRLLLMLEKLNNLDMALDREEFQSFVGKSCPSRLHLAVFLKEKGFVKDIKEAFGKYIGPGKPAYVPRVHHKIEKAISLLKKAGGVVVLAHPVTLGDDEAVIEIIKSGIDGIEAFYPAHSQSKVLYYCSLAEKFNLLITGGSDAHGDHKLYTDVGKVNIEYKYVERLKEKLEGRS